VKPPSEVTVLSVIELRPPLLPLLLDAPQSSSFLEVRGMMKEGARSALRVAADESTEPGIKVRNFRGVSWLLWERLSATILETETEVVAGVTAGRRVLDIRRGGTGFSISVGFRLGDDCAD